MDAKDKGERRETYKNTRESKKRNPSNKQLLLVYRIQGRPRPCPQGLRRA